MQTLEEEFKESNQPDQVKKYALKLLKRWPYILLFFLFSLAVGYAINRYSTDVYTVTARITTKKYSGKATSPIPGLVDASYFLSGMTEVFEEIPILKSPSRIEATLEKLDFRISYFNKGLIKTMEGMSGQGFQVAIDSISGEGYPHSIPIYFQAIDDQTFSLSTDSEVWNSALEDKKFRYGQLFSLGDACLRVQKSSSQKDIEMSFFKINRKSDLNSRYRSRLNIEWAMKGSAMLDLRMATELPQRDVKFIKTYFDVIQEFALKEKNETLDNTILFIDQQMKFITDSLVYYQSLIDEMKLSNPKLSGVRSGTVGSTTTQSAQGSEPIYSKINELDQKRAEFQIKEQYLDYLDNYFKTNSKAEIFAPSLVGLDIPLLETWVNEFIGNKLKSYSFKSEESLQNPLVSRHDSSRRRLEKGIYAAIESERQRIDQNRRDLDIQMASLFGSVKGVQTDFRELSRYERMYQINMVLFDLLIRRKTEAAISKASATPDYEMIDNVNSSALPILPNKILNISVAAAIGLFLPIALFLLIDISNNRIMDKSDLLTCTQMPIIGNIAHSQFPSQLVMKEHPRSVVAESFRAVRANLKFLAANVQTRGHTFLVSSSVGGEGKTFCSLNLAYTLALSQKRTIVIGSDMRKPELGHYIGQKPEKGLSQYLSGYATMEEVIIPELENKLDFIDAGKVPPNPSELMASDRMRELIDYLKINYDYIIIDTPPIGLVSDAMELLKYSDYNILIVRQGVTRKDALSMVNELYLDGKLKNFSVLFNDIELIMKRKSIYGGYVYGLGYGGYGYGYYEEDKGRGKGKGGK